MRRVLVAFALTLAACAADVAPAPVGGLLPIMLDAPRDTDGAIIITVSGGPIDSVTAAPGYDITSNTDASGVHILVVGPMASGTLAQIHVADMAHAGQYVASVEQIADGTTFALLDPAPYGVRVAAPR